MRVLHSLSVSAEFQPENGAGPITRQITFMGDALEMPPDDGVGQVLTINYDSTTTPPRYEFEELTTISGEETDRLILELQRITACLQKCNKSRP